MTTTTILFDGDRVERLDTLADRPAELRGSVLLWVDLQAPSHEDVREIVTAFELDDESAARLADPSDGVSFRDRGAYLHVTVSTPGRGADSEPREVECVVGDNWVVTAHERPAAVLEQFAELAGGSGRTGDLDGPRFLAALLEWVLDEHASAFERIEDELAQVDARGMRGDGKPEDEIERLVALRMHAGKLRRSLTSHRPLLLALGHPELEALGDDEAAKRFEFLLQRYEQTLQGARDVRESIFGSFDVLVARTGHRTNEIVKVLTLASVVFLPGTLIAGVMGMNFKPALFNHPELFWVMIAAIVSIGLVTVVVAKARDWI